MANSNDAMDTVQHNVRILDEALVRLEGGDETARDEARAAIKNTLAALREIDTRLALTWLDTGSGSGYAADDQYDPNHDPRD